MYSIEKRWSLESVKPAYRKFWFKQVCANCGATFYLTAKRLKHKIKYGKRYCSKECAATGNAGSRVPFKSDQLPHLVPIYKLYDTKEVSSAIKLSQAEIFILPGGTVLEFTGYINAINNKEADYEF